MIKIQKNVVIQAPVDRVFEFMTTPENLLEVWPSLVEVTNVKRAADGTHSFDWAYKMAGLRFRGHARTIEVEPLRRVVVKNDKGIDSTFRYTYAGADGGGTKLGMEVEYEIPSSLLERIARPIVERLNDHEAGLLLQNVKTRLELGVPQVAGRTEKRPTAHH